MTGEPTDSAANSAKSERNSTPPPASSRKLVLVIDDEEMILLVAQQILVRRGFKVLVARSGFEGLQTFNEHRDEVDLVLLDINMPGLDGRETLQRIHRAKPDVRVILTSGYPENDPRVPFVDSGRTEFLQKPYRAEALLAKIDQVLQD